MGLATLRALTRMQFTAGGADHTEDARAEPTGEIWNVNGARQAEPSAGSSNDRLVHSPRPPSSTLAQASLTADALAAAFRTSALVKSLLSR